jgi:hypothetical protein
LFDSTSSLNSVFDINIIPYHCIDFGEGLGFSGSEKEDKEKQSGAKEQQQSTSASEGPPKRSLFLFCSVKIFVTFN